LGNAKTHISEGAGWVAAAFSFRCLRGRHRCTADPVGAARRAGLAQPGGVGEAPHERRRAPGEGAIRPPRVRTQRRQYRVHRSVPEPDGSLLHRPKCQPHPDPRLDGCLHLGAQRVCGAGPKRRRCRGRGELRQQTPCPPRRERRRSQLSRSLERTGFAAHLDQAQHAGHRGPRPFCPPGCRRFAGAGRVRAGAIWMDAYNAAPTVAGRYVQGGGCTTVGVAGLVQGGGFGSFSKGFGTAAANLLEAEVVTADGTVRIANAAQNPDLFWALKGGGGGTFGVVTRFTLRTHELPNYFGVVAAVITATSDAAYHALVGQMISFYRQSLFNPHWGEQIHFGAGPQISIFMLFQGLTQAQAEQAWAPLFGWVTARSADYTFTQQPVILAVPARDFWNVAWYEQFAPQVVVPDNLPGAPKDYYYWATNSGEVGQFLHAYQSTWLSQQLLKPEHESALADALVRASQFWEVELHCNKGIAGAAADAVRRTRDTSMNPAVLDSFALAIAAGGEQSAYPGIPGHEPDVTQGRRDARAVTAAMAPLKALADRPASYLNETDYFQADWQTAFWGHHYPRLTQVKDHYDPGGLFFVHHGVGTGTRSADGFTKRR